MPTPLTYYFSMSPSQARLAYDHDITFPTLFSFIWLTRYVKKAVRVDAHELMNQGKARGVKFMLDSGAFTNFQKPGTVSMEQYCEYLKSNSKMWHEYIMLDDLSSREKTLAAFGQMKKEGLNPLFVDHIRFKDDEHVNRIWKKEKKLCLSAWGTVVDSGGKQLEVQTNVKQQLANRADLGRKVQTSVHLLAVTSLTKFLPFLDVVNSVDSATWGRQPGFGRFVVMQYKEIGGLKIPFLTTYDHPGSMKQQRPPPPEVAARWKAFKASRKWNTGCERRVIEFFCIKEIQAYISEINRLGPAAIRNALINHKAEKAEHVSKTMIDPVGDGWDGQGRDYEVEEELRKADEELKQQKAQIQTLIFDKKVFDSKEKVRAWVKEHDFRILRSEAEPVVKPGIDETENSFRVRQRLPSDFVRGSFRTIRITDGVKAVIGRLKKAEKAEWTRAFINDLPDASFLYIAPGGKKDSDGKTVPRSLRYFPVKDKKGEVDLAHLRNALARIPQSKLPQEVKDKAAAKARKLLEEAKKVCKGVCSSCELCQHVSKLTKREVDEAFVKLLPVEKEDADRRIAFGIVLEPDSVDSQGDTIKAEEIEQAAHLWLARFQDRGLMHRRIVNSKIEIYESYIAPTNLTIGGQKVKKGTWLLMYHVLDDELWKQIKSGKLTGFSMGGFARRKPLAA